MAAYVRQLGTKRSARQGLLLGTVRRPPRGVRKTDFARRDFFDLWLPELAPSAELLAFANAGPLTAARWKKFVSAYRREMKSPVSRHVLELLALLSKHVNFAVGCYCEREDRCHRSILIKLLAEHGAVVAGAVHKGPA